MTKYFIVLILFFALPLYSFTQDIPKNDWDTSYFEPGDDDFNLILASERGNLKAVKFLLDRGAYVNAMTMDRVTALMYASQNGHPDVAEYLIQNGANINAIPFNGITALISAAQQGHREMVDLLINNDAVLDARDDFGATALMYASAYNYVRIVESLLHSGASLDTSDYQGTRAEHAAAYGNSLESLQVLLEWGGQVDCEDKPGNTPLVLAAQEGHVEMAKYLIGQGAKIDHTNTGGMSPLATAVNNGNEVMVDFLLEKGADPKRKISPAKNIYSLALESNEPMIIERLDYYDVKPNRVPAFTYLTTGIIQNFNFWDILFGPRVGLHDTKYNLRVETGFQFRPWAKRILIDRDENISYQYWERRYNIGGAIFKDFDLSNISNKNYGLYTGVQVNYSFRRYRGIGDHPSDQFIFSPAAGVFLRLDKQFDFRLGYQYLDFGTYKVSPHRINLGFTYYLNLLKKKFENTIIRWYQPGGSG